MTPAEFEINLKKIETKLKQAINTRLPKKIANEAVRFFKDSFQNEGFTDKGLVKWENVQRRQSGTKTYKAVVKKHPADTQRKVLTGRTGDLGRSIKATVEPGRVVVSSDSKYAKAHNDGTKHAGRNRNVKIPQRQFIGESQVLNERIKQIIEDDISKILNT